MTWLRARVPALAWLPGYERAWFRADVVAGVTTASVIIPKAMAYATLAGLAVQVGLYTALLPMVVVRAPRQLAPPQRQHHHHHRHPHGRGDRPRSRPRRRPTRPRGRDDARRPRRRRPRRSRRFFGSGSSPSSSPSRCSSASRPASASSSSSTRCRSCSACTSTRGRCSRRSLGVAAGPAGSIAADARGSSLVTIGADGAARAVRAAGAGAAHRGGARDRGVWRAGPEARSASTRSAASRPGLPALHTDRTLALFATLWPGALGIALMSFTESIAAGRAFARQRRAAPDANQELLALGAANALGGLFGAMPAGGGTSQTAVNTRAGAHTQVAALVTAGATAARHPRSSRRSSALMPQATLAAVVIVYVDRADRAGRRSRRSARVRTMEFRWAVAAMLGVVVLGTLPGILAADHPVDGGPAAAGERPVRPRARPQARHRRVPAAHAGASGRRVRPRTARPAPRGTHLLRQRAANRRQGARRSSTRPKATGVVLDLTAVPDIEYTGLKTLTEMEASLRGVGLRAAVAALNPAALARHPAIVARPAARARADVLHAAAARVGTRWPQGPAPAPGTVTGRGTRRSR